MIWIVEIFDKRNKLWLPTVGAYLSRDYGRRRIGYDWKEQNPGDRFRIVKYVPDRKS